MSDKIELSGKALQIVLKHARVRNISPQTAFEQILNQKLGMPAVRKITEIKAT